MEKKFDKADVTAWQEEVVTQEFLSILKRSLIDYDTTILANLRKGDTKEALFNGGRVTQIKDTFDIINIMKGNN